MISYMLDTNMCIYLVKRRPPEVLDRFERIEVGEIGISTITLSELEFGASKSSRPERNRAALIQFTASLEVLSYDDAAAARYGPLRAELEARGTPIGSLDMLIAAHALSIGCTLVTNNLSEFGRVPDLKAENWVEG